jgi:hypothetical protein
MERMEREVDPIIAWPNDAQLAPIIGAMQGLNPSLQLRCATKFTPAREETYKLNTDPTLRTRTVGPFTSEYLTYAGTALDVFTVVMPDPPDDKMMSGLTEVNRESYTERTDIGKFRVGPRRIERTADGNLLVRPRARNASRAADQFNLAWQGHYSENQEGMLDQIGRIVNRWGIFRKRHELWEVETAYLPGYFAAKYENNEVIWDPRRPRGDYAYWRTTPVGTVAYIDRYDLPIEEHYARARAILAAGSEFAIVGDVERGAVRVFRLSGVETHTKDFRLPEMPWFEVPIGRVVSTEGREP